MAWDLPVTPSVGDIATVANFATPVINSLSYLHGMTEQKRFIEPSPAMYFVMYYESFYPCILVSGASSWESDIGGISAALFVTQIPDDFVSPIAAEIAWSGQLASSTQGVVWRLQTMWCSSGERMDVGASTSDSGDTGYLLCLGSGHESMTYSPTTNPLTLSGVAAGDHIAFTIGRSSSGDTSGMAACYLHGIRLRYIGRFTST